MTAGNFSIEEIPVGNQSSFLLRMPINDVGFYEYKLCRISGAKTCSEASFRAFSYFLPTAGPGSHQIRVRACHDQNRSISGQKACGPFSKPKTFQVPMQGQDKLTATFNNISNNIAKRANARSERIYTDLTRLRQTFGQCNLSGLKVEKRNYHLLGPNSLGATMDEEADISDILVTDSFQLQQQLKKTGELRFRNLAYREYLESTGLPEKIDSPDFAVRLRSEQEALGIKDPEKTTAYFLSWLRGITGIAPPLSPKKEAELKFSLRYVDAAEGAENTALGLTEASTAKPPHLPVIWRDRGKEAGKGKGQMDRIRRLSPAALALRHDLLVHQLLNLKEP